MIESGEIPLILVISGLADRDEVTLVTTAGSVTYWKGDGPSIGARIIVTQRASYVASEPELLRIPHADVETIQINDGFPCDIGFIVRPNVKISVSTRVGTHMAGPREALTMTEHLFREDDHVRVTFYSCDNGRYTSLTSVDGDPRLELIRLVQDAGGTIEHFKLDLY